MTNFDTYYKVEVHASKATCDISYYKENAFKDYIEMKSAIELELALYRFSEYNRKQYPYLAISEEEEINLFFDKY